MNDPGFRDEAGRPVGAPLVKQFVCLLGVSRHGLSQAELVDLLEPGDPLGNVAALLRLLRPYLMRRGELLDFYHGQLRQVVEESYLAEGLRRAAHQDLASYFSNQGYGSWRTLSELPYHLTHGQRWESLGRVLGSLEFIQAKCSASLTPELIADYRLALPAPGLPEAEYRALSDFSRFVSGKATYLRGVPA